MRNKLRRPLALLLSAVMIVTMSGTPVHAVADRGQPETGLCEHHAAHTDDCGYTEETPGTPCGHEHTEDCYTEVTECVHEHTPECYPEETEDSVSDNEATPANAEEREPENCPHICDGESGCITEKLDCRHEHDSECGYTESTPGTPCTYVCEICNPQDSGEADEEPETGIIKQEHCSCLTLCTEGQINPDCPVCGAENADLSDCKGKAEKEDTKQPEDTGICKHHQEHDDACGYQPESEDSEGSPCTYECRICPIEDLIAALPDKVTEDNADEVRGQLDEILALFSVLTEDEQEQIDLSRCYELQGALDGANDPAPITESVEYQEASWDGSQVTYESKTETCTLVENSAEAVTWTAGWYAVSGTVTIDQPITVNGEVNLILADGCTLNAEKGIVVTTGNSLTIYAQSGGTGTLNATGTTDSSNNASAGIGGSTSSVDSGTITIHGGVINATGGSTGSNGYGGAGIGGGTSKSANGGNSGTIIIYGGTVTANSGAGNATGAGIGGGAGDNVGGAGSNITIYGGNVTAEAHGTLLSGSGAGIGGGFGSNDGGAGSNIQIHGGTVHATGGNLGAGIGGGGGSESGDGTVTISGGTVTAVGGNYAAGIGGGGGYSFQYASVTGGTGSVTITGGIVDASSPTDVAYADYKGAPIGNGGNTTAAATVNKTTGIVFENGAGTVCGDVTLDGSYTVPGDYTLNIPVGASLSGSGTLSGGNAFTTENLTADMISVPTNLYYNGEDRTADITTELSGELDKGITICGQTFTVSGWTLAVAKAADSDLTYTATYTNDSDDTKTVQKTITLLQSGTKFEGGIKTYNGETETTSFTADDTITVKATPTATGEAPANSAMFAASFTGPGTGQMAVFVGDTQVSAPADAADGIYTMEVSASDVLIAAGGPGTGITLTAKFVGNDNMADGTGTATVNITAAARVEKDSTTSYVDKNGLNTVFAYNSGYEDATVTLLDDLTNTDYANRPKIDIRCTLNLNGHTLRSDLSSVPTLEVSANGNVTIAGSGEIVSNSDAALYVVGTAVLEGGTFCSGGTYHGAVEVLSSLSGNLSVTGENVVMENTGSGYGLLIYSLKSVKLSAGKYSGAAGAISVSTDAFTLSSLLNQEGTSRVAYYKDNTTLVTEGLDGQALPGGSYTVKACNHTGEGVCEYTPNEGAETHAMTCLACGYAGAAEDCQYTYTPDSGGEHHITACQFCGRAKTEAHTYGSWTPEHNENAVTIRRSCENCGYTKTDGTFTAPAPGQTMQYGKPITLTCSSTLPGATFSWSLIGSTAEGTGASFTLPETLAVGSYLYHVTVKWPGSESNICTEMDIFEVTPAPLTATGATAEGRAYDGTNSVEITGVTLAGILNGDDVSVDTTGLTGTLNGSNAGTYTNLTLPAMTLTGADAENYTVTRPAGAVPASVTIRKAAPLTPKDVSLFALRWPYL